METKIKREFLDNKILVDLILEKLYKNESELVVTTGTSYTPSVIDRAKVMHLGIRFSSMMMIVGIVQ